MGAILYGYHLLNFYCKFTSLQVEGLFPENLEFRDMDF